MSNKGLSQRPSATAAEIPSETDTRSTTNAIDHAEQKAVGFLRSLHKKTRENEKKKRSTHRRHNENDFLKDGQSSSALLSDTRELLRGGSRHVPWRPCQGGEGVGTTIPRSFMAPLLLRPSQLACSTGVQQQMHKTQF